MYHLRWADDRLKYPFLPAIDQRTYPSRLPSATSLDTKGKGREQAIAEEVQLGHTWKNLCRISLNWQTGSARISRLIPTTIDESVKTKAHRPSIIVRFHRSLLFTASRVTSDIVPPIVDVYQLDQEQDSTPQLIGHITSTIDFSQLGKVGISEIRVDERCDDVESVMDQLPFSNRNSFMIAVFYTTGQFGFFQIGLPSNSTDKFFELDVSELYTSKEVLVQSNPDVIYHQAVEMARFYYPLLVTCSTDFLLSFYVLSSSSDTELNVRKLRLDMRSQTCFWPLSLNLSALDSTTSQFRCTIVYPTPFYPSAWTVGLQEFEIEISPTPRILSNRHATAPPANSNKLNRHADYSGSFNPVSGIEYAEPNTVVVARTDNTLDIFEYHRRQSQASALIHRRTLFGHTSRVAAVAVSSSGRCVSAGQDGLNVWELAEGDQKSGPVRVGMGWSEGRRAVEWVGFDTEKIVGVLKAGRLGGVGDGEDGQVMEEEVRVLSFA